MAPWPKTVTQISKKNFEKIKPQTKASSKGKKTQGQIRSKMFTQPFAHFQVENFLTPELYAKAFEIYNKLEFKEKTSDLFHFFQTNQLNNFSKLDFFRAELDKQFWSLQPMKSGNIKKQDTFYSVFASYYFKGDYLLCHDDIVQDRKYAFSYYLQDHPTGDLVLFDSSASKQAKRIKVRKNTLAIFQVSDISYHEVDYTETDGRKAITGWFNIKGLSKQRVQKTIGKFQPSIPKQLTEYPLPPEYYSEQYFQLMDISYEFNVTKEQLQGPFFERKVHRIEIQPCVVFKLQGYTLLSADFYNFKKGDYILLNDPVNSIPDQGIIDVFVTHLPQGFEQDEDDMLVKIAQPDQETQGIPQMHDSVFVIHRGKKQYYVDRCEKQFILAHFIYVPEKKSTKSVKKVKQTQKVSKIGVKKTKANGNNKGKAINKSKNAVSKNKKSVASKNSSKSQNTKKIKK